MSFSEDDKDESSVSNAKSGSELDVSENEEFPNEQPRKRRRLTPSDDDEPKREVETATEPVLSRIKAKKNGVKPKPAPVPAPQTTTQLSVPQEKISFANLNVKPWLVASLRNMAIIRPTAIQKESIPEILKGRDCIGGSRTGSGKTVAFAVPMLQKWAEDRKYDTKSPESRVLT